MSPGYRWKTFILNSGGPEMVYTGRQDRQGKWIMQIETDQGNVEMSFAPETITLIDKPKKRIEADYLKLTV